MHHLARLRRILTLAGNGASLAEAAKASGVFWKNEREMLRQARASGMLWHFNALFEGIAVDPKAERMWLAAERERRGLLVLHRQQSSWQCTGGCVLMALGGALIAPKVSVVPARAYHGSGT